MSNFQSRQRQRSGPGVPPNLRARALRRDRRLCQLRYDGCAIQATEVDHITPVFEGGEDEMGNLQSVCAPCHKIKTQSEAQRARQKFSRKRPPARHPGQFNPFDSADQARRARARELMGYPSEAG